MSYAAQADLSKDADFADRVAACVAVEGPKTTDRLAAQLPVDWVERNVWRVAAAPGFADAYAYAQQTGVDRPGRDPGVITDAQLLAAVQALLGIEEVTDDGPTQEGADVQQPGVPG